MGLSTNVSPEEEPNADRKDYQPLDGEDCQVDSVQAGFDRPRAEGLPTG